MKETARTYSELDTITIPDDVLDVGIESGVTGTVVDVSPSGILAVEVSDKRGATLEILDVKTEPEPHVIGRWFVGAGSSTS
jgi:hypothetical protein